MCRRIIGRSCAVVLVLAVAPVAWGQTMPSNAPATSVTVDASTPKGALKSLAVAMAQGDVDQIRALFDAATPAQQKLLAATARMAGAVAGLNRAMVDRFGQAAVTPVLKDTDQQLKQSLKSIDAASEKIDGDSATESVAPGTKEGAMSLHRTGGSWKVQLPEAARGLTDQQSAENVAMITPEVSSIQTVTAEVQAGKYASVGEAVSALRARMAGASTQPAGGAAVR